TFCFAGFGTDRLRCKQAMKTADRENPNRWAAKLSNRASGADDQNRPCSIKWAAKEEKLQPLQWCFFLTCSFIELTGQYFRVARYPLAIGATRKLWFLTENTGS